MFKRWKGLGLFETSGSPSQIQKDQLQWGLLFHFKLVGMAMFQVIGLIAEGTI